MDGVVGLQFTLLNSPIIIDHHRSPTLREEIDFSITSHFQMASTACTSSSGLAIFSAGGYVTELYYRRDPRFGERRVRQGVWAVGRRSPPKSEAFSLILDFFEHDIYHKFEVLCKYNEQVQLICFIMNFIGGHSGRIPPVRILAIPWNRRWRNLEHLHYIKTVYSISSLPETRRRRKKWMRWMQQCISRNFPCIYDAYYCIFHYWAFNCTIVLGACMSRVASHGNSFRCFQNDRFIQQQ